MDLTHVTKRDGSIQPYKIDKITAVALKALQEVDTENTPVEKLQKQAEKISKLTEKKIQMMCRAAANATPGSRYEGMCKDGNPAVEEIQDLVETALMELDYFEAAKAFILYRDSRKKIRERNLFRKRTALKPYEYPELAEYVDAVRHSYWIHTEFSYTSDVHDFKVNINDTEREAIKRAMLAIAQIEVAVKTFWGDLYKKMPKPELGAVGQTFAESEVRHMHAYSHLLEILGLNDAFKTLTDVPAIQKRISYLDRVITMSRTDDDQEYTHALALFSLFIEHVSLFSQFLIMMAFNKHRNLFKGISNAVEATSKEEQIHGLFGTDLINLVHEENPGWFTEEYKAMVQEACRGAYEAEMKIVDWILEKGELDFLPKAEINEFIKDRFNTALSRINVEPIFEVDKDLVAKTDWFDEEVLATKHTDFFYKRSINYSKRTKSVTEDDLF